MPETDEFLDKMKEPLEATQYLSVEYYIPCIPGYFSCNIVLCISNTILKSLVNDRVHKVLESTYLMLINWNSRSIIGRNEHCHQSPSMLASSSSLACASIARILLLVDFALPEAG